MKDTGKTGVSRAFTGKHEAAAPTGRHDSVSPAVAQSSAANTSKQRAVYAAAAAESRKKKTNQKRALYIIFTSLAAAVIIVAAFILKGAAVQRSYNNYYSVALQSYLAGDYDVALANLRRAAAISDTDEAVMLMVDCYEKQGNYDKALELLEELYRQDKNNTVVSARIAEINEKKSDLQSADMISIAGKQYEIGTSTLTVSNSALGNGLVADVVQLYSLTTLALPGNSISDVSALSSLGGLTYLDLTDNFVTDLTPLSGLRELRILYLDNNPITDFTPLYSLEKLELLSIRGIGISAEQLRDLAAALPVNCAIHSETAAETVSEITLGGATFTTDVSELDLSGMGISDLTALSACKGLKKLNITGNSVSDLTPLMDLPALEWLCIKDNLVSDLRPLMGMSSLRYINAEGNNVTSTAALSTLEELKELYLAGNPISDVSGIRQLKHLRKLGLEETGITDDIIAELYGMDSLDVLRIYDNPALSGEAVDKLKSKLRGCNVQHSELLYSYEIGGERFREDVEVLQLAGRGISDISVINKFTMLQSLDLGSNNIENIYIFQYLSAPLSELILSDNNISDITPLMYLKDIETLDLSYNRISQITPLMQLEGLRHLDLRGNPLMAEQVQMLQDALPDCEIIFDAEE